jgi:hypothetical protein
MKPQVEISEAAWHALNDWVMQLHGHGIPEGNRYSVDAEYAETITAMLGSHRPPDMTLSAMIIAIFGQGGEEDERRSN